MREYACKPDSAAFDIMARIVMLLLASVISHVQGAELTATAKVNPIRRVVTMLQSIEKKVQGEAERDEELHKKFMCYCKTGVSTLEKKHCGCRSQDWRCEGPDGRIQSSESAT